MPEVQQPTLKDLGFINITEIAEILRITQSAVLAAIKVGLIETYTFGLGSWGISRASVEEYYHLHIWSTGDDND